MPQKNPALIFLLILFVAVTSFAGGIWFNQKTVSSRPNELSKNIPSGWKVYENIKYGVRFYYPPYLVIEEPVYPTEALFTSYFIGQECASIPPIQRGHTPSLLFTITEKGSYFPEEPMTDVCSNDLGPNCRGSAHIRSVPLSNGLEATLIKSFGVSGDGTSLTITRGGLEFSLASNSGPVPCGEKSEYVNEIFKMANTVTFLD